MATAISGALRVLIVGVGSFGLGGAMAQGYPVKPVRIVVGYAAGGGTDVTARMLGQKMAEQFGQAVVVEKSGARSAASAASRTTCSSTPR